MCVGAASAVATRTTRPRIGSAKPFMMLRSGIETVYAPLKEAPLKYQHSRLRSFLIYQVRAHYASYTQAGVAGKSAAMLRGRVKLAEPRDGEKLRVCVKAAQTLPSKRNLATEVTKISGRVNILGRA